MLLNGLVEFTNFIFAKDNTRILPFLLFLNTTTLKNLWSLNHRLILALLRSLLSYLFVEEFEECSSMSFETIRILDWMINISLTLFKLLNENLFSPFKIWHYCSVWFNLLMISLSHYMRSDDPFRSLIFWCRFRSLCI